jgi:hypothetical protein
MFCVSAKFWPHLDIPIRVYLDPENGINLRLEQSGTSLNRKSSIDSESSFGGTKDQLKMPKNIKIDEGLNPLFIRGKSSIELFTTESNQLTL